MSKYNNMKSIPIKSIPPEKLPTAIKEFAEGNKSLENLLWACYNNGVETAGSHAGTGAYLQLILNKSKPQIRKMLNSVQPIKNCQVYITPDGGNPFSGPDWYKGCLLIGVYSSSEDAVNSFFDILCESLTGDNKQSNTPPEVFSPTLDLLEFFDGKDSGLFFRCVHTDSDEYRFSVEMFKSNRNIDYYTKLLETSGLEIESTQDNIPVETWYISSKAPQALAVKMQQITKNIISNYTLQPPTEVTPDMTFHERALVMRRFFGDSPKGQEEMQKWLAEQRILMDMESKKDRDTLKTPSDDDLIQSN